MEQQAGQPTGLTFAETVASVARGEINDDATKELRALVAEMMRLERTAGGKPKGKITLTISLKLDRGVFETEASTKVTYPPKVQPRAMLYVQADGGLSEHNPHQGSLDLGGPRDVSTAAATNVRSITDRRRTAANDPE
jgi:hypothetical protein